MKTLNKILLTVHGFFSLIIVAVAVGLKIGTENYDLIENMYFSMIFFAFIVLILTFMLTKNSKDFLYHSLISVFSMGMVFKLSQFSLEKFFLVYFLILLYGFQIYLIDKVDFFDSKWITWSYFLIIYIFMPFYGLAKFYRNNPVLTTILDNDLSSFYGINIFFSGLGYIGSFINMDNYLGYRPFIFFLGLTIVLFIFYACKNRKGEGYVIKENSKDNM